MSVKDDILAAGVTLLRERGIVALTQPQVAREAGIKQSHLTYYFPTRADLLLAIAEHVISTFMGELSARFSDKPQAVELADVIVTRMIEGIPPRVIIGLIVAADTNPEMREPLRALIHFVRAQIQMLLSKVGLDDSPQSALMFHAMIVGLAVMHQARMNTESEQEIREGVAAMMTMLASERAHTRGQGA